MVRTEERFPVFVTQFSGDQAFRVKQDIVAGITLSITPRHSGGGEITTAIKTEVTSITGTTSDRTVVHVLPHGSQGDRSLHHRDPLPP